MVVTSYSAMGIPVEPQAKELQEKMIAALKERGGFAIAESLDEDDKEWERKGKEGGQAPDEPEYTLKVTVANEGNPRIWMAVISGITLTILPAVASDYFTIDVALSHRDGRTLGKQQIKQDVTTLIQFFMLFGMPFAHPGKAINSMWEEVTVEVADWCRVLVAKHRTGAGRGGGQ